MAPLAALLLLALVVTRRRAFRIQAGMRLGAPIGRTGGDDLPGRWRPTSQLSLLGRVARGARPTAGSRPPRSSQAGYPDWLARCHSPSRSTPSIFVIDPPLSAIEAEPARTVRSFSPHPGPSGLPLGRRCTGSANTKLRAERFSLHLFLSFVSIAPGGSPRPMASKTKCFWMPWESGSSRPPRRRSTPMRKIHSGCMRSTSPESSASGRSNPTSSHQGHIRGASGRNCFMPTGGAGGRTILRRVPTVETSVLVREDI